MHRPLTAIARSVSPAMNRCELSYRPRQEIDIRKAEDQHRSYVECLKQLGVSVVSLPAEPELPDSVFVEDPAVVLDEIAVVARMGAPSRRGEAESLARALSPFRPLRRLHEPATLEGGDVLRAGSILFVGASARTNPAGLAQLASEVTPLGYTVRPVAVRGCLHLKSACCYLGDGMLLANRAWVDTAAFQAFRIVDVAADEPWAANVLAIGDSVLIPAAYPATARILENLGRKVQKLDISELMKAEAGVTCSSLIFET